jgi:hypothetical protein
MAGVGAGTSSFCVDTGDCGTLILEVGHAHTDGTDVVVWACGATFPSSDPDFIGLSITQCKAVERVTGAEHTGLRTGNAGPATATAGGFVMDEPGTYGVCVEGEVHYIDGVRSFSACISELDDAGSTSAS